MNAAVLMFTACLAGAEPAAGYAAPAAPGYAAPGYAAPAAPGYAAPAAPSYPAYPPAGYAGNGYGGQCCGHASVDCCDKGCWLKDCCLLKKIKEKICCFHIHISCDKDCCNKGPVCAKPACHQPCPPKPACHQPCPPQPACHQPCPPQPACHQPCPPQPACHQPCPPAPCPCAKPTCCTVKPACEPCCTKICWKPGYCLHKCKEKLCGLCDKGDCHGGCGTAATPYACGSTMIAPAGPVAPVAPVAPAAPKAMPDVKKIGSAYPAVRSDVAPASGTTPRVIDLTPNPF